LKNHVKQMLRQGKTSVGAWMSIMNPETVYTMANAGFDWLLFDTEHGPYSVETVWRAIQAMRGTKAIPLVRVAWNDIVLIKRLLDIGSYGIVVPWVNTKKDAIRAVEACKYPPKGLRGVAPGNAVREWGISIDEYLKTADDEIMVIVQIERDEAVKNLEEIVSVDGVDATLVGPSDLSASMNLMGQPWHPRVVKSIDRVLEVCKRSKVAPGIAYGADTDHVNRLIAQGWQFVGVGADLGFLQSGAQTVLKQIKR